MSGRNDLRSIALEIVAAKGPIPVERLMGELGRRGVQRGYAYKAAMELIRDGYVKRTFFGELYIPGRRGSGEARYGSGTKTVIVIGLVFVVGVMATIIYTAWSRGLLS
jgi:hypothetical protein